MHIDEMAIQIFEKAPKIVWRRVEAVPVPYYYCENGIYMFRLLNGLVLSKGSNVVDAWHNSKEI